MTRIPLSQPRACPCGVQFLKRARGQRYCSPTCHAKGYAKRVYDQERRAEFLALGLCWHCKQPREDLTRTRCARCRDAARRAWRACYARHHKSAPAQAADN